MPEKIHICIEVKNKFQKVDFNNVDEFLDYITPEELAIVEMLRSLVFQCIPNCREKLAYNVPYYHRNKNICFIWPSSVQWGNMKERGVRFGFTNGHLLSDELNYLDKGDRKHVFWKDFKHVREIEVDLLKSYILDAGKIDETFKKTLNRGKKA